MSTRGYYAHPAAKNTRQRGKCRQVPLGFMQTSGGSVSVHPEVTAEVLADSRVKYKPGAYMYALGTHTLLLLHRERWVIPSYTSERWVHPVTGQLVAVTLIYVAPFGSLFLLWWRHCVSARSVGCVHVPALDIIISLTTMFIVIERNLQKKTDKIRLSMIIIS